MQMLDRPIRLKNLLRLQPGTRGTLAQLACSDVATISGCLTALGLPELSQEEVVLCKHPAPLLALALSFKATAARHLQV